uniref:Uncharacterized protein n=1 Tax=Rhizophora mucronata TaxID=61149 RepID=A0A2P2KGF9_RHIMU
MVVTSWEKKKKPCLFLSKNMHGCWLHLHGQEQKNNLTSS